MTTAKHVLPPGMGPTVRLELALAGAIALVRRARGATATSIEVGKEEVDHLRYELLATDAVYKDMDRRRGDGHDRTRTFELRQYAVGDEWARMAREADDAHLTPPRASQQRLAAHGITYAIAGYRSKSGGNRHVLTFTDEALAALRADDRVGERLVYFADLVLGRQARIPRGSPTAPRTVRERLASRRSKAKLRARQVLAGSAPFRGALRLALGEIIERLRDRRTIDVVTIPGEAIDGEDLDAEDRLARKAGFRDMARRGLGRMIADGRRFAFSLNLRALLPHVMMPESPVLLALDLPAPLLRA